MTITTVSAISAPVNRTLQRVTLSRAKALCLYFSGSQAGDVLQSHSGTYTVLWRRYDNIDPSVSALSELTGTLTLPTRTAVAMTKTDVTATVQKYGQHIYLTEEVEIQEYTGLGDEIAEILGITGGKSLNRLQRNILEDNLTAIYEGGGATDGAVGSSISVNSMQQAVNALDNNDAIKVFSMSTGDVRIGTNPILPAYRGFCHNDVMEDIMQLPGFKGVETYAGHVATLPGEFGIISRIRWASSSEGSIDADLGDAAAGTLRSTTGVSADLYPSIVIGEECHGALSLDTELIRETYRAGDPLPGLQLIFKGKGTAGTGDPLNEISSAAYKTWHAGAIKQSIWGRMIRSAANRLV